MGAQMKREHILLFIAADLAHAGEHHSTYSELTRLLVPAPDPIEYPAHGVTGCCFSCCNQYGTIYKPVAVFHCPDCQEPILSEASYNCAKSLCFWTLDEFNFIYNQFCYWVSMNRDKYHKVRAIVKAPRKDALDELFGV